MSNLENNFSIYPYDYEDELAKKRAAAELLAAQEDERVYLAEKIAHPAADATVRGIGDLAIQSVTGGILQPTFDTEKTQKGEVVNVTPEQARAFGDISLRDYMLRSTTASTPILNDRTVIGYAEHRAA